jgi:hypothetical protein
MVAGGSRYSSWAGGSTTAGPARHRARFGANGHRRDRRAADPGEKRGDNPNAGDHATQLGKE